MSCQWRHAPHATPLCLGTGHPCSGSSSLTCGPLMAAAEARGAQAEAAPGDQQGPQRPPHHQQDAQGAPRPH